MAKKKIKNGEYFYKLYEKAHNVNSTRFAEYAELCAFYEQTQSELPQYALDKPWVFDINAPYASDAVNLRVASLQANDYLGELEALSPDDEDNIQKLNYAYHSLWNEENTDKHVNEAILRAAIMREAYTHVVFDADAIIGGNGQQRQGAIEPYSLDPACVNIDPEATGLRSARYVCLTERISLDEVTEKYKKFDASTSTMSRYTPEQRGEIYFGHDYTTEQDTVLTKLTFYEVEMGKVYKTVLVEDQIVEPTKQLLINRIPIAQLRWQKKLKSPYGTSLLDTILPLQKTVNEIESAIANTALQFSSPSYVMTEDSGIDPNELAITAGTPGAIYVVQSGIDIDRVIKPLMGERKIDEQMVAIKKEMEDSIYKLAGVNDAFTGDLGTVGNTKEGTNMATQRAQIIEQRFLVNLEEYVEDLTRIYVDYILKGFGGETIYVKRENSSSSVSGGFDSLDVPRLEDSEELQYNFYIKLDVKTKYSKEVQRTLLKDLYQQQQQYQTEIKGLTFLDVLKTYDVPQIQGLVERFERLTNMDAQQRAELVTMIVTMGAQYNVPNQLVQAAIQDVILNAAQTPNIDAFQQAIVQQKAKMEQAQQSVIAGLQKVAANKQKPVTGDESYDMDFNGQGAGQASPEATLSGNEEFFVK